MQGTRSTISDDPRIYNDEEFALILRKAAELAEPARPPSHSPGGLTLAEIKAAAAQVGFDPALVERATRLLPTNASAIERLIGGQIRHRNGSHFPIVLDETGAAKLLSAVRISVGRAGDGHSSAMGLTWRNSDDGGAVLSVTARADQEGTSVTVELDRRGTLVVGGILTLGGCILTAFVVGALGSEIAPALGAAAGLTGAGGVLALARSYWASSTRTARDRISCVMDSVSQLLTQSDGATSDGGTVAGQAATAGTEGEPAGDAS